VKAHDSEQSEDEYSVTQLLCATDVNSMLCTADLIS